MRIYISGAMTSDPDYEEKFSAAERWVRRKYPKAEVVNPVRLSRELEWNRGAKPDSLPRHEYLKKDISELMECDRLVAIPGFEKSAGAMLEINIALSLFLVVGQIQYEDFNSVLDECRKERENGLKKNEVEKAEKNEMQYFRIHVEIKRGVEK